DLAVAPRLLQLALRHRLKLGELLGRIGGLHLKSRCRQLRLNLSRFLSPHLRTASEDRGESGAHSEHAARGPHGPCLSPATMVKSRSCQAARKSDRSLDTTHEKIAPTRDESGNQDEAAHPNSRRFLPAYQGAHSKLAGKAVVSFERTERT